MNQEAESEVRQKLAYWIDDARSEYLRVVKKEWSEQQKCEAKEHFEDFCEGIVLMAESVGAISFDSFSVLNRWLHSAIRENNLGNCCKYGREDWQTAEALEGRR